VEEQLPPKQRSARRNARRTIQSREKKKKSSSIRHASQNDEEERVRGAGYLLPYLTGHAHRSTAPMSPKKRKEKGEGGEKGKLGQKMSTPKGSSCIVDSRESANLILRGRKKSGKSCGPERKKKK